MSSAILVSVSKMMGGYVSKINTASISEKCNPLWTVIGVSNS